MNKVNYLLTNSLSIICILICINGFAGISGQLPQNAFKLCFQENKGQVVNQFNQLASDVLFSGTTGQMAYHLKHSGISYQFYKIENWKTEKGLNDEPIKIAAHTTIYRLDYEWKNINSDYTILKENELEASVNYYTQASGNIIQDVKTYKSVTYKNIYGGIDLKWYERNGGLEYDFIVKPFSDYNQIKIELKGHTSLSLNKKGELLVKTPFGNLIENAPLVFQNNKQLKAKWVIKNNSLSFYVEDYNPELPMIIDPAIRQWGTYYGAAGDDYGNACTVDGAGNVYMVGYTNSATSIALATTGSHQTTFAGGTDGFIAKFTSAGVRLWGTYYGGTGDDIATSCCIDNNNNLYVAGYTNSSTGTIIATTGSHQQTYGGGLRDAFVVKFNSAGVRQWATYYGGTGEDFAQACAIDPTNTFLYVAGLCTSNNGNTIATGGAHQTAIGGFNDAMLVKFNLNGVRQWGTYYGGTGQEDARSCCVATNGDVYIAGSSTFNAGTVIATLGSHQDTHGGGGDDAFLAKFNSNGVRIWGTYYGGSSSDKGYSCCLDPSGNIYLAGTTQTNGGTAIATAISHQNAFGGVPVDGFLAKFNSNGVRQWGTYYGGFLDDRIYSCTSDLNGNIYVCGETKCNTANVIATAGNHQPFHGGAFDGFLVKFNNAGIRQWGTYYGASGDESSQNCFADPAGNIYMCGFTNSNSDTIPSSNAHQTAYGGGIADAFLVKISECELVSIASPTQINVDCGGMATGAATIVPSGGSSFTYSWTPNTGSTGTISNLPAGAYTCVVTNQCANTNSVVVYIVEPPTITVTASANTNTVCQGSAVTLNVAASGGIGTLTYTWNTGATSSVTTVTPSSSGDYTVNVSDALNCLVSKVVSITVNPNPSISVTQSHSIICAGESATLTPSGANTYTLYLGAIPGTTFNVNPAVTTSYTIAGTDANGCIGTNIITQSVDACVGIKELGAESSGFRVYPNPTNSVINVEFLVFNNEPYNIELLNIVGQVLYKETVSTNASSSSATITLKTDNLQNGIYFLQIFSENKLMGTQKIIKE